MVPGSIPGAGATSTQTPQQKHLEEFYNTFNPLFTTFLQQTNQQEKYLNEDTKYLQIIGTTYYFVKRIKDKIVKKSLKTSNLKTANIHKEKILKGLKSMEIDTKIQSGLKIAYIIEDGDDEEEAKKIIASSKRSVNNKVDKIKDNKISSLTTETIYENDFTSIEEEEQNFYKHCRKTQSNIEEQTIYDYQTSFKYLYLKFKKETKLYEILKYEDWDNFRDFLISLPFNAIRRYNKENNTNDIDTIVEQIVLENEEKNEDIENEEDKNEVKLLAPRTINKHFAVFSKFLNYLALKQKIVKNPIYGITKLVEYPNPYKNFEKEEIIELLNVKDSEKRNFFKVMLYTGIRLSAVISIKKEDYDIKTHKLKILKDKTTNGIRTVIIHKEIRNIFEDYVKSDREFLFFDTDIKDKVQKTINPFIYSLLGGVKKTIHGFRKNFTIELYKHTTDNNFRKYIIGHSQKGDITFTVYNLENIDFNKMEDITNKIKYPYKKGSATKSSADNFQVET